MINSNKDLKLAIIGLGYVGLPLALEFAKKRLIIGFDINKERIKELQEFNCNLDFYDPWANRDEIKEIFNVYPHSELSQNTYDGIVIAVAHEKFKKMGIKAISNLCTKNHVIYDLKYLFNTNQTSLRL